MKRKPASEILEDFIESYQENPRGWSFWVSRSNDNFDIYIIRKGEGYFLKLDSIFTPHPIGIGTKVKMDEDQMVERDLPQFGFRKFNKRETRRFLRSLPSPPKKGEPKEKIRRKVSKINEVIERRLLGKPTIPFRPPDEGDRMAVVGPLEPRSPLAEVSESQRKLERDLERKLRKMRQREYPGYY